MCCSASIRHDSSALPVRRFVHCRPDNIVGDERGLFVHRTLNLFFDQLIDCSQVFPHDRGEVLMDFSSGLILGVHQYSLRESCGHIGHGLPNERLTGLEFFFDERRQRLSHQWVNDRSEMFLREDVLLAVRSTPS